MWRYLVGLLAVCGLAACNQIFGIPDVSQSDNSCAQRVPSCAPEATCTEASGGSTCACNAGYTGDGLTCSDVDECAAATSPCSAHSSCTNMIGTFACPCDAGYTGDNKSYCVPTTFRKMAPAGNFSCGLGGDGGIYCWGSSFVGNLGDGTNTSHAHPKQVGTATDWIDLDARLLTGCGIRADHSMWCWGLGINGQLGEGKIIDEMSPVKVMSSMGWKAMSVGRARVCGIHDNGSLECWGIDRTTNPVTYMSLPTPVDGNTDWTAIAVGTVHCGLRGMPGTLYCWGKSNNGELGLGMTTTQITPAAVGTDTWKVVKVGYNNACAIRSDNALFCWGTNPQTNTSLKYGNTPQQVGTATDWQALSMSVDSVAGLRAGGTAYAWGSNSNGQLGHAPGGEILQPTAVGGTVVGWTEVKVGNGHSCGIAGGQAYCWGNINEGNLGTGASTALYAPTKIGSDRWTALTGGPGLCGLRSDGALMCWGFAREIGAGFGNTDPVWTPTRLGTDTWSAVAGSTAALTGVPATCAIRGGKPYCWGDNSFGELGIGNTNTPQLSPVAVNVPSASQWTEIAVSDHTCAIASDATLFCWGANDVGQLGNGQASVTPTTAPSTAIPGAWLHIAVTRYGFQFGMSCGIKTDHTLWCWGQDQYPMATQHLVPTQVGSDATWATLSMAATGSVNGQGPTTCAIKMNGTLWCWGLWLGDGTMNTSPVPVQVGTATDWKSVAIGGEICATRTGGTLWCWANQGILGDGKPSSYDPAGSVLPVMAPMQISSDTDWSTVVTNGHSGSVSCAIKTDGSLWCWGNGAAPIPGFVSSPTPIN